MRKSRALLLGAVFIFGIGLGYQNCGSNVNLGQGNAPEEKATPLILDVILTVSDGNILEGESVDLVWKTENAVSCVKSLRITLPDQTPNFPQWTEDQTTSSSNSGLQLTLEERGTYDFSITCKAADGSEMTKEATVIVGVPADPCLGVTPSFGLTRQTSMLYSASHQGNFDFAPAVWPSSPNIPLTNFSPFMTNMSPTPFPARTGNATIAVQRGKFVALAFNTGTVNMETYGLSGVLNRFGSFTVIPPAANGALVLMAISRCPGDFTGLVEPIGGFSNRYCRVNTGGGVMPFKVGEPENLACNLRENTQYYLNFAHVAVTGPSGSEVAENSCSDVVVEPSNGVNPNTCHNLIQPR